MSKCKMVSFRALFALVLLVMLGCMPALRVTRFLYYPPRPPDHVIKIYRTTVPDQPYEEIGIVSSRQRNKLISMQAVIEYLMYAAQNMGGDAIIGLTEDNEAQGFVGGSGKLDRDPVLSGTVIRFIDMPERPKGFIPDNVVESTSQILRIKIVKENVVLMLNPDLNSLKIKELPLGAILDVETVEGEWIRVKLPPDKVGNVIVGYVHKDFIIFIN